ALLETTGFFRKFEKGKSIKYQPGVYLYSKHRLDFVWNFRKSQLVRNRYFNFLQHAMDQDNNLLHKHYIPVHLVLTVPHGAGKFKGKDFYARELIETFTKLRKMRFFKQFIYAGEFGVEVKRGKKGNGLHIHIHSFLLQYPEFRVNEVRKAFNEHWNKLTGNSTSYSGISFETLYTVQHLPDGSKKKHYVKPGKSDLSHFTAGVLECIKYHFKPDCLEIEKGGKYDIELIKDILKNTKGLRMYNRIGQFYNEKALCFNHLQNEELNDENINGDAAKAESKVVNPFNYQMANDEDFSYCIGKPDSWKYYPKDSIIPFEPYSLAPQNLINLPKGTDLKKGISLYIKGQFCK
nr:protein rep [Flammeovirgaceae bacterium]